MRTTGELQFIWPKDGPRGRGHRGFFGRLNDILTNRGPDIFIGHTKSSRGIPPEIWGNWDSYHSQDAQFLERNSPGQNRREQRYDPYSRKYVEWAKPRDWMNDMEDYPRFTLREYKLMRRREAKGKDPISPKAMGKDWHWCGPKRFRFEHDYFWRQAHVHGEEAEGRGDKGDLCMAQDSEQDPYTWWEREGRR